VCFADNFSTQIKSVSTQIQLQEKLSGGAFKYRQNCLAAGAPARTPLWELTVLPQTA